LIVFQNGHISGALAELIRSTRAPTKDRLMGKIMAGNPPQPLHAHASAPPLGRVRTELIPAERASAMTSAMALWLRGAMM
jgi:hypothetical protein